MTALVPLMFISFATTMRITTTGERWFQHRKLITPTFHFNILDGFCDVFAEQGAVLAERLEPFANTGKPVDVFPFITKAALDIICGE